MAKKANSEAKSKEQEASSHEIKEETKIRALGPSDAKNGATILRYKRKDGRRTAIDIQAGMILNVGDDITQEEADRLLNLENWQFERVSQ